jgi:hypothetical protein
MKKRGLALLLAVAMIAALCVVTASADDTVEVSNWYDLNNAIQNANGKTIVLTNDITVNSTISIYGGSSQNVLTINLNGHKLSAGEIAVSGGSLAIDGNTANSKVVGNITVNSNGSLTIDGGIANLEVVGNITVNSGTLTIDGGTYQPGNIAGRHNNGYWYQYEICSGIRANGKSQVTIENATIQNEKGIGLYLNTSGEVEITNCTIEGQTGVYLRTGEEVTIENTTIHAGASDGTAGDLTGRGEENATDIVNTGNGITIDTPTNYKGSTSLDLNNVTVTSTTEYAIKQSSPSADARYSIAITGGKYIGKFNFGAIAVVNAGNTIKNYTATIKGGEFSSIPDKDLFTIGDGLKWNRKNGLYVPGEDEEVVEVSHPDKTDVDNLGANKSMAIRVERGAVVTFNSEAVADLAKKIPDGGWHLQIGLCMGVASDGPWKNYTPNEKGTEAAESQATALNGKVKNYFTLRACIDSDNTWETDLYAEKSAVGTATVDLYLSACEIGEPADGYTYQVYYIPDGAKTKDDLVLMESTVANGYLSIPMEHFSSYVIIEVKNGNDAAVSTASTSGGTLSEIYKLDPKSTTTNGQTAVTIALDGAASKFKFVRIDGYLVSSANISIANGELTIAAAALAGLKDGSHRIDVIFTDGKAVGTLVIDSTAESPSVVTDPPAANPSTGAEV